jgi:hypothetical protein
MLPLLVGVALAAPVCPASITEFTAAVDDAERSFVEMNAAAVNNSLDDAIAELSCTQSVVPPALAARLHRAMALRAFITGDEAGARRALYAAKVLDPAGDFSDTVVPPDHPLRALLPGAILGTPASVPAAAPASGTVYFDGRAGLARPSDRPAVFQLVDPRGDVRQGTWLSAEAPLPTYAVVTTAVRKRTSLPLAIAGGAALLAGGVTYGIAGATHARFEDLSTPRAELEGLSKQTNTLVFTSAALGALGLAGGVTAVIVGEW